MKKLLAVVLAAATVASLGVTSFAASADKVLNWGTADYAQDVKAILDSGAKAAYDDTSLSNAAANGQTVTPDNTLYFDLYDIDITTADGAAADTTLFCGDFTNKDLFKVKTDKGDTNAKMIASVALSEKNITGIDANANAAEGRGPWIEVKLKDDWTDSEYKIAPSITLTTKKDLTDAGDVAGAGDAVALKAGYKVEIKVGKYYISNISQDADQDYAAGTGGVMLKPQKNEDNEIIWHDENRDLARLTFVGDSNVNKVFPKLSTKWENEDYAELFADQNAFYFDFVANVAGKTTISSTSRATLEIYNPYYDKDEDTLLVDPADVVIYEVAEDGTFEDVTAAFTAGENDDGDSVFVAKTRELGTYIFAEKTAGVVEEVVEAPAKDVPNTGR